MKLNLDIRFQNQILVRIPAPAPTESETLKYLLNFSVPQFPTCRLAVIASVLKLIMRIESNDTCKSS